MHHTCQFLRCGDQCSDMVDMPFVVINFTLIIVNIGKGV